MKCLACGSVPPRRSGESKGDYAKRKFCNLRCYGDYLTLPLPDRLSRYVEAGEPSECWEWQGSRKADGYGMLAVKKKTVMAHRAMYELHIGPIPLGMIVRHTCDNPPCCNPAHLVLGTPADNSSDMVARDRQCRGDAHPLSPLTSEQVVEIRKLRAAGATYVSIADRFGVNFSSVSAICTGRTWKHVGGPLTIHKRGRA